MAELEAFLSDLRPFFGLSEAAEIETLGLLLKNANTGIKALDTTLKALTVERSISGYVLLGEDVTVGNLHNLLRCGNLPKVLTSLKSSVIATEDEIAAFRTTIGPSAERLIDDLESLLTKNKKLYSHLDATLEDLDKLSSTAKKQLQQAENNLFKYVKNGAVISLVVGTVYVGANWIVKETERRRGCFMFTTIDGVTTSCKVGEYSCVPHTQGYECANKLNYRNTTLILMKIATLPDNNSIKIQVARAVDSNSTDFAYKLPALLTQKFKLLSDAVDGLLASKLPQVNICGERHEYYENGVIPPCRMCDPTALPNSTQYINPAQYGKNITFRCITNPSVLDVITDTADAIGQNLLDFGFYIGTTLKWAGILAIIVIVAMILLSAYNTFIARPNTAPPTMIIK